MSRGNSLIASVVFAVVGLALASPSSAGCEAGGLASFELAEEVAAHNVGDDLGTGTGGTGVIDPLDPGTGTGGTGILGVVTGFGSVCVNDFEIEYDARTNVMIDGDAAHLSALAIGQIVRIATSAADQGQAVSIDVEHAIVGPIESSSTSAHEIVVMGQRVLLSQALRDASVAEDDAALAPGARIAVSGFRKQDGAIRATRITAARSEQPDGVTGSARTVDQAMIEVGSVRAIAPAEGDFLGESGSVLDGRETSGRGSSGGRWIRLVGEWNSRTRLLEATRVTPIDVVPRGAQRVSMQGFIARDPTNQALRINGIKLEAAIPDLDLESIPHGRLVRVDGAIGPRQTLRVDRLDRSPRLPAERIERDDDRRRTLGDLDRSARPQGRDLPRRRAFEDRPERHRRPERPDRPRRPERPQRPERLDRPDRPGR